MLVTATELVQFLGIKALTMFSLVITLISVALVAALALATLYYGSSAFEKGVASTQAARLEIQAQQLRAAAELYKADTGGYPMAMEDLVSANYLKSIPVASAPGGPALFPEALAVTAKWTLVTPGYPVFAVGGLTLEACEAVNRKAYGVSGILRTARAALVTQCFGTSASSLTLITAKTGVDLINAASSDSASISVGTVISAPLPDLSFNDTSPSGWFTLELVAVTGPATQANPILSYESLSGQPLSHLSFAYVPGEPLASQSLIVRNTGTASLVFTSRAATVSGPFSVLANGCAGATLAPSATCQLTVALDESAVGIVTGTLLAESTARGSGQVALGGTVAEPPPDLTKSIPVVVSGQVPGELTDYGVNAAGTVFTLTRLTVSGAGCGWSCGSLIRKYVGSTLVAEVSYSKPISGVCAGSTLAAALVVDKGGDVHVVGNSFCQYPSNSGALFITKLSGADLSTLIPATLVVSGGSSIYPRIEAAVSNQSDYIAISSVIYRGSNGYSRTAYLHQLRASDYTTANPFTMSGSTWSNRQNRTRLTQDQFGNVVLDGALDGTISNTSVSAETVIPVSLSMRSPEAGAPEVLTVHGQGNPSIAPYATPIAVPNPVVPNKHGHRPQMPPHLEISPLTGYVYGLQSSNVVRYHKNSSWWTYGIFSPATSASDWSLVNGSSGAIPQAWGRVTLDGAGCVYFMGSTTPSDYGIWRSPVCGH